ncbi:thioredoxin-like protein [Dactylonectria estremocensis]|uniref:Thioredoxin-like protein n=1 Tax=Dactylonectria estremocensis TaxID=1079267 RepID=A0A9P9I978_9HYPO|nr:thioredoxin-like protein [Dactylonectria estremocensis]
MTNFKVTVTLDTLCPWCYVGHKQLQLAEQLWKHTHPHSDDTFLVRYQSIQLQPIGPKGPASSVSKEQFFAERFGKERSETIHEYIKNVGKAVGIDFKFGGRTGNSWDSHRLIHLAKKYGEEVEGKVLDGVFAAHFEQERDITQYSTLERIAIEAGIPVDDFRKAIIDSDIGGLEVDQATNQSRLNGVASVPDYVIQDRYQLRGANDVGGFIRVFERVKAEEAT